MGRRDQRPGSPGTATHIVPLRLELLLLEALVLPEVADVGQGFPDDQQEHPDQHDSRHGASHDGSNVGAHWTLSGLIHVDVVSVPPILLPQGVGHPAAVRVTLLTLPGLLGGAEAPCLVGLTQQLQVLACHTAVLPEGALVKF